MVDGLLFSALVAVPALAISWAFGPGGMTGCEIAVGIGIEPTPAVDVDGCTPAPGALRFTRIVFYALTAIWIIVHSRATMMGASIGKRSSEIMVIDATTGETIPFGRAMLRTVLSMLSFACFGLGLLWSVTNRDRRTAHDVLMGTRVISP